jgi:hypothetical protein
VTYLYEQPTCYCAPATYWEPAQLCGECEARMEDEARQEAFEAKYADVDTSTGYPA